MPFDGTDRRAVAAIAMIDALLGYFDGGNKWLAGNFHDAHGRRCLLSAMAHIRQRDKTTAVRGTPHAPERTIEGINDSCLDYPELADILRRARAFAAGAPPGPITQEAKERHAKLAAQRLAAFQQRWPGTTPRVDQGNGGPTTRGEEKLTCGDLASRDHSSGTGQTDRQRQPSCRLSFPLHRQANAASLSRAAGDTSAFLLLRLRGTRDVHNQQ